MKVGMVWICPKMQDSLPISIIIHGKLNGDKYIQIWENADESSIFGVLV